MVKLNNLIELLLESMKRLRLGNVVFFLRLGRVAKRQLRRMTPREKKRWNKKHPPTPEQKTARLKFTTNRQLAAHMSRQLRPLGVWRRAVEVMKPAGMNADNFLFHVNHKCMTKGEIVKFSPLVVSMGLLLLPDRLEASREGNTVTLRWVAEESADRLHVAVVHDDEPDALVMVNTGYACRGDGAFSFPLPANSGAVHVYPFFSSEGTGEFSANTYFDL